MDDESNFVVAGLSLLAKVSVEAIGRIIVEADAEGVVAVAWKARISMRFAVKLQFCLANVPATKVLRDPGFGEFPFLDEEMEEILAVYSG